jgi:hypothetical protein
MAMAASGSVGETIAPSANAAAQDRPATRPRATTATAAAVTRTRRLTYLADWHGAAACNLP